MRIIDADELEELFRAVIFRLAKNPDISGDIEHMIRASATVIEMIQDAPSIEVLSAESDLIACGDCKYYICHDRRCGYWNHGVKPLMWCSQAERRSDG